MAAQRERGGLILSSCPIFLSQISHSHLCKLFCPMQENIYLSIYLFINILQLYLYQEGNLFLCLICISNPVLCVFWYRVWKAHWEGFTLFLVSSPRSIDLDHEILIICWESPSWWCKNWDCNRAISSMYSGNYSALEKKEQEKKRVPFNYLNCCFRVIHNGRYVLYSVSATAAHSNMMGIITIKRVSGSPWPYYR